MLKTYAPQAWESTTTLNDDCLKLSQQYEMITEGMLADPQAQQEDSQILLSEIEAACNTWKNK